MKFTYESGLNDLVLAAFDKTVDSDGYVVEKEDTSQKVLTRDGYEVQSNWFGGVKKGSEIFISSDLVSIMNLCRYLSSQESN